MTTRRRINQREKSKQSSDHRPRNKCNSRISALIRAIEIRKREIRTRFPHPLRHSGREHSFRLVARDRRAEHFPVVCRSPCQRGIPKPLLFFEQEVGQSVRTFGISIRMSRVERHAVFLEFRGVKGALHVVDALWYEVEAELFVGEEVVQEGIGGVVAVLESGVCGVVVVVDGEGLPLGDVVVGDGCVVRCVFGVSRAVGYLGHGFYADDALDCEVGLVA